MHGDQVSKRPAVLVVDDEEGICQLVAELLAELPVDVIAAADGLTALQHIKSRQVDVVVSDLKMPKLSGLDLLEMARMYGFGGPVIMITGYGRKEDVIEAVRFGAFDFIEKPFKDGRIVEVVKQAVEISGEVRRLMAGAGTSDFGGVVISRGLHQAVVALLGANVGRGLRRA